jgi:hypothetical protein
MHFVGVYCIIGTQCTVQKHKVPVVKASKEEADKHIAEFKDGK